MEEEQCEEEMEPKAHSIGGSFLMVRPCSVAIQLNTLMPVGMAMIIVAEMKYARVSTSIPTVNMRWARTIKPRNPIDSIAQTFPM